MPRSFILILMFTVFAMTTDVAAQPEGFNYDEAKVPKFTLPDPLTVGGKTIATSDDWMQSGRPEVLRLFEEHVYGRVPPLDIKLRFRKFDDEPNALGGKAIRRQVTVFFSEDADGPSMDILLYLPKSKSPVPVFVAYNFYGNHTITKHPGIRLSKSWVRNSKEKGTANNRATEASRGTAASRWPVEMLIDAGYGLAVIYYGDVDPDFHDKFKNGVHVLDQTKRTGASWGSVATWAWGLSRALDYFETDSTVDHKRVIVMGHSRLGKTSLWAGATDQRFAGVISNDSGCGGAALSRRAFGETVKRINTSFPHWFCKKFREYNDNETAIPVDQHMLAALIAPRPLYIASAQDDQWADPRGEFLSGVHAEPVYRLFGTTGVGTDKFPNVDEPVGDLVRYHMRTGKHDVKDYDWQQYIKFADAHVKP
jgi:hypothetical protein